MEFTVGGNLIHNLHKMLYIPNKSRKTLELELNVQFNPPDLAEHFPSDKYLWVTHNYTSKIPLTRDKDGKYSGVSQFFYEDQLRVGFRLTVDVKFAQYVPMLDVLDSFDGCRLRKLKKQEDCNYTLISKTGKAFHCHFEELYGKKFKKCKI